MSCCAIQGTDVLLQLGIAVIRKSSRARCPDVKLEKELTYLPCGTHRTYSSKRGFLGYRLQFFHGLNQFQDGGYHSKEVIK
jgi:hypothetical protein